MLFFFIFQYFFYIFPFLRWLLFFYYNFRICLGFWKLKTVWDVHYVHMKLRNLFAIFFKSQNDTNCGCKQVTNVKKKHNNEKRQKIPRIIKLWIPKPCKKTKWVRKKTHLNQIDMHDCVYMIYFNLHLFLCRLSLFADFFFLSSLLHLLHFAFIFVLKIRFFCFVCRNR